MYEIFQKDFITSQPFFRGIKVWTFPEKEDGKEIIFWHLTSRVDPATGERLPDLRRSELLPWVRFMIEHPDESEVLTWDYEEGDKDIHTYMAVSIRFCCDYEEISRRKTQIDHIVLD